ncbi:MAG: stage II sporulation protein P [Clostridia bacterium]|nr:stage II sporulation protein P [Clostridia bacterium]
MIKIRVLSLREVIMKFILFIGLIVIIYLSIVCAIYLAGHHSEKTEKVIIDSTLLAYHKDTSRKSDVEIIRQELGVLRTIDIDDETEQKEEMPEQAVVENKQEEVSSIHEFYAQKISDSKYKVGSVYINSYLKQDINLAELSEPLEITTSKPCSVLIYHTHTSESYTIDNTHYSDYYRTEDNQYNVVAVGKYLAGYLENDGFQVVQDTTKHDYPSYNGAYKASLATVEKHLKTESYDIIFDIHRDALSGNSKFRPTAEINGETAAKIMIVVGTNDAGLEHPNWMKNFKFAIALQEKGNEMYPGLFRDMHLSTSRYNQHTSDKTLIIEVGATGNTMEETKTAMKYFADVLNALIN